MYGHMPQYTSGDQMELKQVSWFSLSIVQVPRKELSSLSFVASTFSQNHQVT